MVLKSLLMCIRPYKQNQRRRELDERVDDIDSSDYEWDEGFNNPLMDEHLNFEVKKKDEFKGKKNQNPEQRKLANQQIEKHAGVKPAVQGQQVGTYTKASP